MSLSTKNKRTQVLLFSLATTLIIFTLYKNSAIKSSLNFPFSLRNLLKEDYEQKRCKKTHKKFIEKYNESEFSKVEFKGLTKYQKILKDMIEEEKFDKIKKYIKRILLYIIFLIVDVLLIIFWFVFCGCCCCCKRRSSQGCFKCNFLIFFLLSILVILICIVGYFSTPCLYKSFNDVICSLYKLVNHFIDGTNQDFPKSNWKGFEGIQKLITKYENTVNEIDNLPSLDGKGECSGEVGTQLCDDYKTYVEKINAVNEENFMTNLKEVKNKISDVSDSFTKIKDKKIKKIEDIMEYFDKYCKLGLFILFSVILGLCFLSLLTLTGYFVCNIKCLSCLYHLFWNIEMLFIIITMIIGILFGTLGLVSKDAVSVLKYTVSTDNLVATDTFLIDINDEDKQRIDLCFNGNGDLSDYALEGYNGGLSDSNDANFREFENKYNEAKDKPEFKESKDISDAYSQLYSLFKNLKELYDDLNSDSLKEIVNCKFVGWDFKILTDELNNSMAKTLVLFSLIIIVSDLIAFVSILFGIFVVSQDKSSVQPEVYENSSKQVKIHLREDKHNMDYSSDNLRK